MANVFPNYQNAAAHGVPAFENIDTYLNQYLLAGNEPGIQQPVRMLLGSSLTLAQFTVVGLNAAGALVPAVWDADEANRIAPVGVLAQPATSGAANTTILGEVFLEGNFNSDAESPLVWGASFDTEAKKQSFNGANSRLRFTSRRSSAAI